MQASAIAAGVCSRSNQLRLLFAACQPDTARSATNILKNPFKRAPPHPTLADENAPTSANAVVPGCDLEIHLARHLR